MLFDELMNSHKMEDPEERKAQPIQRVQTKSNFKKVRSTSISMRKYRAIMLGITVALSLAVLIGIGVFIYLGVRLFIGG